MKNKVLVSFDDIEVTMHMRPGVRTHIVPNRPHDLNITEEGKDIRYYYCGSLLVYYEYNIPT